DVDYSKFLVENVEEYIPQGSEYEDVKKILLSGKPVLLTGIKGIGKSLMAANIAKELGIPRFVFNCSQSVCEDDIIGNFVDLGLFADGVVTQAVRAANELGMAMLVLEEVNAMQAGVAMTLHTLLDFNKSLVVKPTGEVYKVNGHGRLLIVATANIGYQGTLPMNEAFKSRFVQVHLPNPKPEMMLRVARKYTDEEVAEAFVSIVKGLQEAAKRGELSDFPSIRELVTACHLYNTFRESGGVLDKKAFEKAVKYTFVMPYAANPSEADLVKNIIASSCPIRVSLE
ncbi:MAG: AAA family ATPase, partial [Deltaproteobacteria bacterium]|nr:AAA family ATPase [Deltaproteobacteria bacterium]